MGLCSSISSRPAPAPRPVVREGTPRRERPRDKEPSAPARPTLDAIPLRSDRPARGEHRAAPRFPASHFPSITSVRFSPHGADASLVNISSTGILTDCRVRLQPGTVVTVIFDGGFSPASIEGRVARTSVAAMDEKGLRYHVGIVFNAAIELPEPEAVPAQLDAAPGVVQDAVQAAVEAPLDGPVTVLCNRW